MSKVFKFFGEIYGWGGDYSGSLLEIDLESGTDLVRFLKREHSFWTSILGPRREIEAKFKSVVEAMGAFTHFPREAERYREFKNTESAGLQSLYETLHAFYRESQLPFSDSLFAGFLRRLSADNPLAAICCLEMWLSDSDKFESLPRGPTELAISALIREGFLENAFDVNPEKFSKKFKELNAEVSRLGLQQQADQAENILLKEEWKKHKLDEEESLSNACKKFETLGNDLVAVATKKMNTIENTWDELKSSVENMKSAMKNQIALDASVDYWEKKAEDHKQRSFIFGGLTALYFLILGRCIWLLFGKLPSLLGEEPVVVAETLNAGAEVISGGGNLHLYAVQAALGFAASTLIFWVGRILTRLFLSEHHLRIDADERLVMTKTFLAFTAEGEFSDAERSLLLAPLFRPTADGIVKDDAAPEFSLAAFLSKSGTSS